MFRQLLRKPVLPVLGFGCALYAFKRELLLDNSHKNPSNKISLDQLKKHNSKDTGVWVAYKGHVYDITHFIPMHPGGEKILLAAGGDIDPFWKVYTIHQKPEVLEILSKMKVGELDEEAKKALKNVKTVASDDTFKNEPARSPILVVRSQQPFNAETPLVLLSDEYLTPNDVFYKRNHLPVPSTNEADYHVELSGIGVKPVTITLNDLRTKFKQVHLVATLQCAGNRRAQMKEAGAVQGLGWEGGAIGNAVWTGVLLKDILEYCGLKDIPEGVFHVEFRGKDGYGASVPADKAFRKDGDVMLAYAMNGQPLLPDHGFPLRALIPGHVAARSVKWVDKIVLGKDECEGHWQQKDYRGFNPSSNWDKLDWQSSKSIQELPVQSAITFPSQGSKISGDELTLKGYAWSGGGRDIIRVDVSIDGGKTWALADLVATPQMYYEENREVKRSQSWGWSLWQAQFEVPPELKGQELELVCKAIDSSYNVQPDTVQGIYNKRGVLSNAWHRIKVEVE